MPFDFAGNTLNTSRSLELTPSTQTFTDWVGPLDTRDFYSFTLSGSSSFALTLDGMSANANLRLLNGSGQLLQTSTNPGITPESIQTTLSAGSYYILVLPENTNASTFYNLSVSANQAPQELQFNTTQSPGTVSLTDARVYDGNSYTDLSYIDFWLQTPDGNWQDVSDANSFTPSVDNANWANFNYQLSNLIAGNYTLQGTAYDLSGAASEQYQTAFTVAPYIRVTTPNGGESWQPGSTYNITWTDNIAENIKLELYKGGSYYSTITSSTLSDGSESWTVPTTLASGTDYQLRITSITNSSVSDYSNSYFSVTLPPPATISNLIFSGNEGDSGTFQIKLNQAPTSNVTLTFNAGSFLTIDADNVVNNGTNNTITFTPTNWNQAHTVSFIAENDGSSSDRTSGNTIGYTLSGGASGSGTYNLGVITNTYAPDTSKFNIELDFRNDYLGFWTPARQTIAQKAADDWASLIANELSGLTLTNQTLGQVGADGTYAFNFTTNQYVDDLVIFVGAYETDGSGGWGSFILGGNSASDPLPRVGGISVNSSVSWSNATLYSVVAHEIGHTLGLLGMNYTGYQLVSGSGTSWVFTGAYSKAYNNGQDIPLQSEDHGGGHPANSNSIESIMSYAYLYNLSAPSQLDKRFLADSGYLVYGVNA